MNEANDGAIRAGGADYEQVLTAADQSVASFDEEGRGPLRLVQHFLHTYPTAIPFIVLLIGTVIFSAIVGERFVAPFNLSLVKKTHAPLG